MSGTLLPSQTLMDEPTAGHGQPEAGDDAALAIAAVSRIKASEQAANAALEQMRTELDQLAQAVGRAKAVANGGSVEITALLDEIEHRIDAMSEIGPAPVQNSKVTISKAVELIIGETRAPIPAGARQALAEIDWVPTVSGVMSSRNGQPNPTDHNSSEAAPTSPPRNSALDMLTSLVENLNAAIPHDHNAGETAAAENILPRTEVEPVSPPSSEVTETRPDLGEAIRSFAEQSASATADLSASLTNGEVTIYEYNPMLNLPALSPQAVMSLQIGSVQFALPDLESKLPEPAAGQPSGQSSALRATEPNAPAPAAIEPSPLETIATEPNVLESKTSEPSASESDTLESDAAQLPETALEIVNSESTPSASETRLQPAMPAVTTAPPPIPVAQTAQDVAPILAPILSGDLRTGDPAPPTESEPSAAEAGDKVAIVPSEPPPIAADNATDEQQNRDPLAPIQRMSQHERVALFS